ncbi:MAG: hypothetical protein R3F11_21480 [Verrucomicrobiales bacterium]
MRVCHHHLLPLLPAQIARRSPREIAFVGIAFIAGVFAAYFLLGLGLIEVVARLQVHSAFRLAFNWLLS